MKNRTIFLTLLTLAGALCVQGQSEYQSTKRSSGNYSSMLVIEPFIGATASLPRGDYIDYHKSFHSVVEEGTVFKGSIHPVYWGTLGFQLRYTPFEDDLLSNLSISVGLQYLQKGFVNQFNMTHTPAMGYKDVTDYKETYRHHYLAVPVQLRWGKKWFGTLGLSSVRHQRSTKEQSLKHKQSGNGSLNGGFDQTTTDKKKLEKTLLQKSQIEYLIGGGYQFSTHTAVALRINFGGDVFQDTPMNYKNTLFEFSLFKSFNLQ
jgi:hypothetical protein